MKYIKSFTQIVNEGAHLMPPNYDKVELSLSDDKTLPLEVLKTNPSVRNNFTGPVGSKGGNFQIFYGLTVDPELNLVLGQADPLFKKTLDALKKGEILNAQRALVNFTNPAASAVNARAKVDYIVSLGSTAGLSHLLGESFTNHFKNAKHFTLSKYKFATIAHAFDWDYIRDYEERNKKSGKVLSRVKQLILDEVDKTKTPKHIIDFIKNAKETDYLINSIAVIDPDSPKYLKGWDENDRIFWKKPSYQIRSSGQSFGGSRKYFKTKYDTPKKTGEVGSAEFIEAVYRCITAGSVMMFVDDNARTKEDLLRIFDTIDEMADKIINAEPHLKESNKVSLYRKRFLAYVLIYIPDAEGSPISVKKLASETKVKDFTEMGLEGIELWIKASEKRKELQSDIESGKTPLDPNFQDYWRGELPGEERITGLRKIKQEKTAQKERDELERKKAAINRELEQQSRTVKRDGRVFTRMDVISPEADSQLSDELKRIKVGSTIDHTKFGEGIVIGVDGTEADRMITVKFYGLPETNNTKRLSLQLASKALTLISE